MATKGHNLSHVPENLPKANPAWKIAIVKAAWNAEITDALASGARETLLQAGLNQENIFPDIQVPGSYELPLGAQWCLEAGADAVICVGAVIRGETSHFDYVCEAVSQGVKDVSLAFNAPVMFCVLTDDNIAQSRARSGGKHGNKGVEAAIGAIQMLALRDNLS